MRRSSRELGRSVTIGACAGFGRAGKRPHFGARLRVCGFEGAGAASGSASGSAAVSGGGPAATDGSGAAAACGGGPGGAGATAGGP
eukprot:5103868-Pyramimonas_sp.AAC.1